MRGAVCAASNRNQVVKRISRAEIWGKCGASWILQTLQFITRQLFFHLSPQIHWLYLLGHQSLSPSSPQTIHVACPVPSPQKSVISMVKFNPIHLNMHRQGLVRTSASFITLQLLLLLCIAVLRACMVAAQICLRSVRKRWWERNVIGKAIEHLSLHQTAWDYDFFFSLTPSVFRREKQSTAVAILAFIAPPPTSQLTSLSFNIANFRVLMNPGGR